MSNSFKKVTSAVAGLAVVFSIVSPIAGVSAAYTSLEAANKLATLGVIVDQSSNPADYRLGDTLTRREHVKVAMNLAACQAVAVSDTCNGSFSDMDSSDWGCKYAETALANGFIAANATFNPGREVSKAEALKMIMNATGVEKGTNPMWEAAYVEGAVEAGILSASFSDYTSAASRGWIFQAAAEAVELCNVEEEEEDDLLGDLLDGLTDEEEDTTTDEEDTTDTPVVSGSDVLMVSLSPSTPDAATIPGGVNGLPVAAFDLTAGSSDVTVSQVTVKRRGLSDEDTLISLAVFTDEGRASNSKNDNQENNTEAQLNLSNGGVVVKAGETKTLWVITDVASVTDSANDEFALELVGVQASSSVDMDDTVANTMRVGSVDAPLITFDTSGSVSNPQLGETGADIFEFEINGSWDEDVVLKAITFEANGDAEENLMNFELFMGNKLVASTQYMNDDYLTFDLGDGLTIEEDKNEDFTVKADVVAGAGETIGFNIDEALDVTAESTKFGYGASVNISAVDSSNAFGTITIEAGQLTLVEIDAEFDEIREDKDNVVLWKVKVTNVAGQNLELQEFGIRIAINAGTTTNTLASQFLSDVELYSEDTGSSYELKLNGTDDLDVVYSDSNIDVVLPQGTTTWAIRADTAESITNFDTAKFQLSLTTGSVSATTGGFYVEETEDDQEVTDITPSSLSFNSIDGTESGAKVALVPLADKEVVRGANDVVALQFTVEAEKSSAVIIDELSVEINGTAVATNQHVSNVKLYKWSVSESNLLDTESGSNIGTGWDVTFDDMNEIIIPADGIETFIVTVSFVDGADAVTNSDYTVSLIAVSAEDDENDDVTVLGANGSTVLNAGNAFNSARQITVNNSGTIATLALDTANEDNEFDKLALAGGSAIIASWDVRADNEEVDVETVEFTVSGFAGSNALRDTVVSATLLLDGVAVATNSNSDISNTSILFDDLTSLIIPETTTELALQLNTANIGDEFTGESLAGLAITDIVLSNAEGVESGKNLDADGADNIAGNTDDQIVDFSIVNPVTSKTLDIVSAIVTPSVVSSFGSGDKTAEIRLVVDGGDNTNNNGDAVQAELTALKIEYSGANLAGETISVRNSNGTSIANYTVLAADDTNGYATVTVTSDSIGNDNETYEITISGGEAIFRLAKDGVTYTINGATPTTVKLENTLGLGEYDNP